MEISAKKTKLTTNSDKGIQREIKVKGQKLGTVTSLKYLGAVVSDDGSKPEVSSRIAQATAALTKLRPIWRSNIISLGSKVKPMRPLVISILLSACESWTLTEKLEKRTQAFEMRCYQRSSGLAKTILQGTVKGERRRDREKKRWEDNIKEWTGMDFASSTRAAENRQRWRGVVANSSVVPRRPSKVMR